MKKNLVKFVMIISLLGCKRELNNPKNAASVDPTVVRSATSVFKGVNWADPGDNFSDGDLAPSGISTSDSYATIQTKTGNVATGFINAGANTVRLPINPPTVTTSWWQNYVAIINTLTARGMKVILGCWEGASSKDGLVDNTTTFQTMWDTVVARYSGNTNVYFEVFNEPHGYSVTDLKTLYANWLARYPSLSRGRIFLDGAGYATDVNDIGADSRFASCLLSFHDYTWFESRTTVADWEVPVKSLAYPDRTVVTEFGVTMNDGTNYLGAPGSNLNATYFQGMTNSLHDLGIGGVYWPGLRTGDSYSMFTLSGSSLTTNNASGLTRLKYAWGSGTVTPPYASLSSGLYYHVLNRNSGKALDVNGSSTANGGTIIQWDYWGGTNQQWQFNSLGSGYYDVLNRNSGKALDVNGSSTTAGTGIIQWDYNGGANQQWQIIDIGYGYFEIINKNSSMSLDVNGASTANGATVIQWNWNDGANQQWQIVTP